MAGVIGQPADEFRVGYLAGLERAREAGLLVAEYEASAKEQVEGAVSLAASLLDGSESPRFLTLFGEMVSVAAIARVAYEEEPLTADALAGFLDTSKGFFNSWVHRDEDRFSGPTGLQPTDWVHREEERRS